MSRRKRRLLISLAMCIPFSCAVLLAQEIDAVQTASDIDINDDSKVSEFIFELDKPSGSMLVNWTADVGYSTGPLTRFEDFLLLGVNIENRRNSGLDGAAMLCVDARSGLIIDSLFHSRMAHRANDMPGQAIKSKLTINGDMGCYVSNRGELVAVDLSQLSFGGGVSKAWMLDMASELRVFKRDAGDIGNPACSPLIYGENVYCLTGHGTTFGYRNSFQNRFLPKAPSFIAVNKRSGQLIWQSDVPYEELLLGQWGSPIAVSFAGLDQIIFPGGNGTLYGLDPETGKTNWVLPCNPDGRTDWTPYKRGTKCFFAAKPTVTDDMLFASLCQDEESLAVDGVILAIDLSPLTKGLSPKIIWTYESHQFGQNSGELSYHDGHVYGVSRSGKLIVLDAASGEVLSLQSIGGQASMLGSVQISDGQIFVASENELIHYSLATLPKCIARYRFRKTVENSPLVNGTEAFVTTRGELWSIDLRHHPSMDN